MHSLLPTTNLELFLMCSAIVIWYLYLPVLGLVSAVCLVRLWRKWSTRNQCCVCPQCKGTKYMVKTNRRGQRYLVNCAICVNKS